MHAEFRSHTSLNVSTSQLRFEIGDAKDTPRAAIEFAAAARTYQGGEVLLTVDPIRTIHSPQGGPSANLGIGYEGEGGISGTLSEAGPHVVGRWVGSGMRPGRVLFALHGADAPGVYLLSLKFVLSAP